MARRGTLRPESWLSALRDSPHFASPVWDPENQQWDGKRQRSPSGPDSSGGLGAQRLPFRPPRSRGRRRFSRGVEAAPRRNGPPEGQSVPPPRGNAGGAGAGGGGSAASGLRASLAAGQALPRSPAQRPGARAGPHPARGMQPGARAHRVSEGRPGGRRQPRVAVPVRSRRALARGHPPPPRPAFFAAGLPPARVCGLEAGFRLGPGVRAAGPATRPLPDLDGSPGGLGPQSAGAWRQGGASKATAHHRGLRSLASGLGTDSRGPLPSGHAGAGGAPPELLRTDLGYGPPRLLLSLLRRLKTATVPELTPGDPVSFLPRFLTALSVLSGG